MADTLVSIAIPCPLRRHFDYLWPDTLGCAPQPGLRVRLPFGRRELVGVVLGESEGSQVDTAKLRAVSEVLDDSPSLSAELLALGRWAARYYHHPIGDCLHQMLPVAPVSYTHLTLPTIYSV